MFPTNFPTGARPFPDPGRESHQEIVCSHPIPSNNWLPTFPAHSHPAVNKRGNFPIPSLGKTQKIIRPRRVRPSHPVPRGTARTSGYFACWSPSVFSVFTYDSPSIAEWTTAVAGIEVAASLPPITSKSKQSLPALTYDTRTSRARGFYF